MMQQLSQELARQLLLGDPGLATRQELPERVLQFGTGVLLRGLPEVLIEQANRQQVFNGRVVLVKSTDTGDIGEYTAQDHLYTVCHRGVEKGQLSASNLLVSTISRVIPASTAWQEVLACAANPDLTIVISNTTEVGIKLVHEDIHQHPPLSFPGKLLAFLYARYQAFAGDPARGLILLPTELLPDNGQRLESILLELAHLNQLEGEFIDWLEQANHCCNTLVDRIVPGKPQPATLQQLEQELGYRDALLVMAEPYALWAIEGDADIAARFPLGQACSNVVVAPNIQPFRELKLHLLNGGHTFACGLAYLAGFDTVADAMANSAFANYLEQLLLSEIVPTLPPTQDPTDFALRTMDRFRNPFIEHQWLSISMQYSSKMYMRNVPTLLRHYHHHAHVPPLMALGLAAYLLFMRAERNEGDSFWGQRHGHPYPIKDDQAAYFFTMWQNFAPAALVPTVLRNMGLWGTDLAVLPGLTPAVLAQLERLLLEGPLTVLEQINTTPKSLAQ